MTKRLRRAFKRLWATGSGAALGLLTGGPVGAIAGGITANRKYSSDENIGQSLLRGAYRGAAMGGATGLVSGTGMFAPAEQAGGFIGPPSNLAMAGEGGSAALKEVASAPTALDKWRNLMGVPKWNSQMFITGSPLGDAAVKYGGTMVGEKVADMPYEHRIKIEQGWKEDDFNNYRQLLLHNQQIQNINLNTDLINRGINPNDKTSTVGNWARENLETSQKFKLREADTDISRAKTEYKWGYPSWGNIARGTMTPQSAFSGGLTVYDKLFGGK